MSENQRTSVLCPTTRAVNISFNPLPTKLSYLKFHQLQVGCLATRDPQQGAENYSYKIKNRRIILYFVHPFLDAM